jgi:hypothetical protein
MEKTSKREHDTNILSFAKDYFDSLLVDVHNDLHMFYSCADSTRDRRTISRRIDNEGITFITTVLPTLINDFLIDLEGGQADYSGFRTGIRNYPVFLRRLFAIVMNDSYTAEVQARAFHGIYSLSCAFKKLRGNPDEDRHQEQYDDFVKVDAEIGAINFEDPELKPYIDSISTQWTSFASDINLDDKECIPRPGPGATVGSLPKHMRYAPRVWFKQLENVFPMVEWFYTTPWEAVTNSRETHRLLNTIEEAPYSEYLLVPKTYIKWRGICKERNEVQFLQQALRRLLTVHIKRKLSNYLPLDDQSVHGKRALLASRDREDATIDESEASDRIARILVSKMASGTPELLEALLAVSTRKVRKPKWASGSEYISTNKFAPMGSAVCFPVMSLLHFFLIRAIILINCNDIGFLERKELCKRVSVYGDDIVLPSAVVHHVYKWLPRFGMKINQTKSFVQSHFRESCGVHAYKGINVTPVYIKYTNLSFTVEAREKTLASLIANEATCYNYGWGQTAMFLRRYIDAKWKKLPYVSNTSPIVGYLRPPDCSHLTNFANLNRRSVSKRWDRFMQSFKYRLECWHTAEEEGVIPSDSEAYLRAFCLNPSRPVRYRWDLRRGLISPFRMDDNVKRVKDKALRLQTRRVPLFESEIGPYGNARLFSTH